MKMGYVTSVTTLIVGCLCLAAAAPAQQTSPGAGPVVVL
jgi:hypothetical protein